MRPSSPKPPLLPRAAWWEQVNDAVPEVMAFYADRPEESDPSRFAEEAVALLKAFALDPDAGIAEPTMVTFGIIDTSASDLAISEEIEDGWWFAPLSSGDFDLGPHADAGPLLQRGSLAEWDGAAFLAVVKESPDVTVYIAATGMAVPSHGDEGADVVVAWQTFGPDDATVNNLNSAPAKFPQMRTFFRHSLLPPEADIPASSTPAKPPAGIKVRPSTPPGVVEEPDPPPSPTTPTPPSRPLIDLSGHSAPATPSRTAPPPTPSPPPQATPPSPPTRAPIDLSGRQSPAGTPAEPPRETGATAPTPPSPTPPSPRPRTVVHPPIDLQDHPTRTVPPASDPSPVPSTPPPSRERALAGKTVYSANDVAQLLARAPYPVPAHPVSGSVDLPAISARRLSWFLWGLDEWTPGAQLYGIVRATHEEQDYLLFAPIPLSPDASAATLDDVRKVALTEWGAAVYTDVARTDEGHVVRVFVAVGANDAWFTMAILQRDESTVPFSGLEPVVEVVSEAMGLRGG